VINNASGSSFPAAGSRRRAFTLNMPLSANVQELHPFGDGRLITFQLLADR
jgi:hypothetical protein